jgi:hypothetical protein
MGELLMKMSRKGLMKSLLMIALGLFLVSTAASVSGQRKAKHGPGNPNWGGSAELRQTALNTGYSEGVAAGRTDSQRKQPFNFKDESEYRSATKGYSSSLGDKTLYQRYFRYGFEKGYLDGWNGY